MEHGVIETPKKRKVGDGTPGPGRPKGSSNKTTAILKDAILLAAQRAGNSLKKDGGMVAYLEEQAISNPGPFMSLLGKVLPMQVSGDPDNPIVMVGRIRLTGPDGK